MKRTYRIMANHPEPSDAEVAHWKNFDRLLADYHQARRRSQRWWGSLAVLAVLVVGGATWMYWLISAPDAAPAKVASQVPQFELGLPPVRRSVMPVTVPSPPAISSAVENLSGMVAQPSDDETFVEATPVGGYPALYDYLARDLRYPEVARQAKIAGTVLLEFTIDTLGRPTNIRVIRGVREDLDQEAIRLVQQMPTWTPASVGKQAIATKHTMPLHFQLTKP